MSFNHETWKFPTEALRARKILLGVVGPRADRAIRSMAIVCQPLQLPDINHGYEKQEKVSPRIGLCVALGTASLADLCGRTFDYPHDVPSVDCSVYLFGAHNPVDLLQIRFGALKRSGAEVTLRLRFDFDFEGRVGGVFEHELSGIAKLDQCPFADDPD